MPDDPNKKGADRKRVSQQPHEQAYQKWKASKSNSNTNKKKVQETIPGPQVNRIVCFSLVL
jgi:hypothetical protein